MVTDKEIEEAFEDWCKRLDSKASFMKDATEGYPRFSGFKAGAKWMQEKMKIENHHCDQCTEERDGEWFCTVCGNG